jgi:hypothetical protein
MARPTTSREEVHAQTVEQIRVLKDQFWAERLEKVAERARLFKARQDGMPSISLLPADEVAAHEYAIQKINGHAPDSMRQLQPSTDLDSRLAIEVRGLDLVLDALGQRELAAMATEAFQRATDGSDEYRAMCRDYLLSAEHTLACERRIANYRQQTFHGPGRTLFDRRRGSDPLSRERDAALKAGVITRRRYSEGTGNMKRVKAFVGSDAERRAERCGHWLAGLAGVERSQRWCVSNDLPLTRAASEMPDAVGGFLVPQDFDAAIIAVREQVGAFRMGAEVRPVASDAQLRPRRIGGVTAHWTPEGSSITESSFQLDALEPSMKKLAVLVRSSAELYEDSAADLAEFVASEVGYAFAATEDDCGFNGDGTSVYSNAVGLGARLSGMKSAVAATTAHDTFAEIDNIDIFEPDCRRHGQRTARKRMVLQPDGLRAGVLQARGDQRRTCHDDGRCWEYPRVLSRMAGANLVQIARCGHDTRHETHALFRESGDVIAAGGAAADGDGDEPLPGARGGSDFAPGHRAARPDKPQHRIGTERAPIAALIGTS